MTKKIEIKDNDRERAEFLLILNAFRRMIYNYENSADRMDIFADMVAYRASALMDRALEGLNIDFDTALELLQSKNLHLTARDELERDIVIAAFDNLIDFATAQQFAMMQELPDELDLNEMEGYEVICQKYNETYAIVENDQVLQAAIIASFWIRTSSESMITFNTQRDERVRELHASFDGLSYKKSEFPPELIPPIEWACRCYLTADSYGSVFGSILRPEPKVNPIFKESLATGGRIFSNSHAYFKLILPSDVSDIAKRLKQKLHLYD